MVWFARMTEGNKNPYTIQGMPKIPKENEEIIGNMEHIAESISQKVVKKN